MKIRLEASEKEFQKAVQLLEGVSGAIPSVVSNAMNRAVEQGKTAAVRCVTKEYTVKSRTVRETLRTKKASKGDLSVELTSRGQRLPLSSFRYSPHTDTTGRNRKQIRVSVKRDGGMKPLAKSFVWRGNVFSRVGNTGLPIEKKFSNAVPVMLNNEKCVSEIQDTMENAMEKRLDHEVRRTLAKAVK